MNYEILGQRLRVSRERARLNQSQAAQLLELTPAALNQYESGKRRVDALQLERLARLYGVPLRSLFSEETTCTDWEESLRLCSEKISTSGKVGIGQLIEEIFTLEELYTETETPFPGFPHPPFAPLTESQLHDVEAGIWAAQKARSHYNLGIAPLIDVSRFLEALGLMVFRIPFGKEQDVISGVFFLHPKLGTIVALNLQQEVSRHPLTLTYGLAYSLFLHDRPGIILRHGGSTPLENFAETFAAYFLIPPTALQERLQALGVKVIKNPATVVNLAYYFGVSYDEMLYRLQLEKRLVNFQNDFENVKPLLLARCLGFPSDDRFRERDIALEEMLPRIFIELGFRAVEQSKLSLRRVAEMLGISDIELEERLSDISDIGN